MRLTVLEDHGMRGQLLSFFGAVYQKCSGLWTAYAVEILVLTKKKDLD